MSKVTRNKKSTKKKTTNKDKELVEVIDVGVPEEHPHYEEIKALRQVDTSKMTPVEKASHYGKIGGLKTAPNKTNIITQARKEYKRKVASVSKQILNAQLSSALGLQFLFKKDMTNPTAKARLVTDPEEMAEYIEFVANGEEPVNGNVYYNLTVAPPNGKTIDQMFDRAFGRAKEEQMDEDEIVGALTTLHNAVERVRVAHSIPIAAEIDTLQSNTEPQKKEKPKIKKKKVVKKKVVKKKVKPKNNLEALKQAQYDE